MAAKSDKKGSKGGVIIKKYEIVEGGHHGGAWKVAYADFVTAMMAFFLLMWLLNATTEEQRKGLADYFSPTNLMSHSSSGSGQPFGGRTAFSDGSMVSDLGSAQVVVGKRPVVENTEDGDDPLYEQPHRARSGEGVGKGQAVDDEDVDDATDQRPLGQRGTRPAPGPGGASDVARLGNPEAPPGSAAERAQQEKVAFEQAAEQIKQTVKSDPTLAELSKQLAVDMTPEGLRVQIIDEVKLPMFMTGSSVPNERARLLIQKIVPVLMKLKHPISIAGHTDSAPFPGPDRTNWELSSERANATRRLLVDGGFADSRIKSVIGDADRDPLLPADPLAAANRRIAILVMRQTPVPPTPAPASPTPATRAPASPTPATPAPASPTPATPVPATPAPASSAPTAPVPPAVFTPPVLTPATPTRSGPMPPPARQ